MNGQTDRAQDGFLEVTPYTRVTFVKRMWRSRPGRRAVHVVSDLKVKLASLDIHKTYSRAHAG